jgi:hypothetical protein
VESNWSQPLVVPHSLTLVCLPGFASAHAVFRRGISKASKIAGHSTVQMTEEYTKVQLTPLRGPMVTSAQCRAPITETNRVNCDWWRKSGSEPTLECMGLYWLTMKRGANHRIQYVLVLLLVCAVTAGQSAALTVAHERHQAQDHGCMVCNAGSLPFLQSSTCASLAPVLRIAWLDSPPDFEATHDVRPSARSSRAPPAESLPHNLAVLRRQRRGSAC